jgi:serpin B
MRLHGCLLAVLTALGTSQSPATPPDDDIALRLALDRFGAGLCDRLAADGAKDANFCACPASVSFALLLTLAGARGDTAAELQTLLAPPGWEAARVQAAAATLLAVLRRPSKVELTVVDDLWPQQGHELLPGFVAASRSLGAAITPVDFEHACEQALRTINEHVAKATNGRIGDLLPAGAVTADMRLILTNAVYFKAKWWRPFGKGGTHEEPFTLANGERVQTQLMHQSAASDFAATADVQVLRLRYDDPDFAMDIALPQQGRSIDAALAALRTRSVAEWEGQLQRHEVDVTLPRFRVDGAFRLRAALQALGLRKTLAAGAADLGGIDGGSGRLSVDDVIHRTFIEVAEEHTEAAAATGALAPTAEAMPRDLQPAVFRADHPFAFAVRDLKSGLVLFRGRVMDPRGAGS